MKPKEGLLVVLSSPSGGGKTTLCNRLMAADANVVRSISCTTRWSSFPMLLRQYFHQMIQSFKRC